MKNAVVFRVAPAAESVREYVEVGRDPLCLPLEVVPDLGRGEMAGHLKADLMTGLSILEEIEAGGRVGLSSDLVPGPAGAPDIAGQNVGEELEVRDVEVAEVGGGVQVMYSFVEKLNTPMPGSPPVQPFELASFAMWVVEENSR